MKIEPASCEDAAVLAHLINMAGERIPEYVWSLMADDDESPMEVGVHRAMRDQGGFSFRNALVCRMDGNVAGMVLSYQQDDPCDLDNLANFPEALHPLLELESRAPGSWYINALAVSEPYRQRGIAKALLVEAEALATRAGVSGMSLIVASENTVAKSIYSRAGYQVAASSPIVPYPNAIYDGSWELMTRDLN